MLVPRRVDIFGNGKQFSKNTRKHVHGSFWDHEFIMACYDYVTG